MYKYSSPHSFRKALKQRGGVSGGRLWGPGRRCCWANPVSSPVPQEIRKEKSKMVEFMDLNATMCYRLSFRMSLLGFYCPTVR